MKKTFPALFPIIVSLSAFIGIIHPPLIVWFKGSLITYGLAVIMLGMGLSLKASDFTKILKHPKWILLGLSLQYIIMPLLGWFLAQLFDLPKFFAVGIILVSCCPGGTASNVITYLARAELALSVTMTACSTLAAILMTPFLTLKLSGSLLEIPAQGLFFSTIKVVFIPICIGLLLNRFLPEVVSKIVPYAPPLAVILICLIVGSIVGQGKDIIIQSGLRLILALGCLHSLGFLIGFIISFGFSKNWKVAKTISIEVGMQNSGLGAVLARDNFNSPLIAIPAALSSLIHSLFGSFFVIVFKNKN